jgi:hypothetical protein
MDYATGQVQGVLNTIRKRNVWFFLFHLNKMLSDDELNAIECTAYAIILTIFDLDREKISN